MKKLFTAIALLIGITAIAQNTTPSPYSQFGQMLNTANAIPNATLDTVTNAATVYLYTAKYGSTGLPAVYPVIGYGSITFVVNGLKISGTPAGNVTLQMSLDGTHWAPVRASTTIGQDTLTVANVAGVQPYSWDKSAKYAPYYRLAIALTGTQASSWQAWYYLNKQFYFTN